MAWLQANWMQVVLVVLAVDRFLIQLFPDSTIFKGIQSFLSGFTGGGSSLK